MNLLTKKLFLLDAMSLIYRAHFAFGRTPRVNSKGINTGAILGFTNSLVEIIQKEAPSHIIVASDTKAPTFRHEAYKEYKAHREAQPEDISIAIPYIKQVLAAFQIPIIEKEGYEADDIIGTLAQRAAKDGFEVYMMTTDKDLAQIVDKYIYLYKPSTGSGATILGVEEVLAHWEIAEIHQVTDILGLQGDASDNILGVPSIGKKTAIKLIKQFGSVENLLAKVNQLAGKLKENVEKYGAQGLLSKQLATIHTDVPIQVDFNAHPYKGPNEEVLTTLFQELEFRTLAQRILNPKKGKLTIQNTQQASLFDAPSGAAMAHTAATPLTLANIHTTKHQYHLVDTPILLEKLLKTLLLQPEFVFDTETTSLDTQQATLLGIAFAHCTGEAYYVPMPAGKEEALAYLIQFQPLFENTTICKIGQNLKYDISVLQNYGITVASPLFDTMLAHALVAPDTRHNLQAMAESYLAYTPMPIEELIGPKGKGQKNMKDIPVDLVKEYAGEDADITLQLYQKLRLELEEQQLSSLFFDVEIPLIQVLVDIEKEGVGIDKSTLQVLSKTMTAERAVLVQEIHTLGGREFNISSPKQLGEILFDELKITDKPIKTKTRQYATGEEILTKLAPQHPIAAKILAHRELQKLQSTYIDALPNMLSKVDGRIHTSYNQAVVTTGRLSSSNPNLQNIPIRTPRGREIRKAFIPSSSAHVLLSADYSQIELRIMASYAKDSTMITAFEEGKDIHSITASKLFKVPLDQVDSDMRRQAKMANFGIIYGISAFGLSQRIETMSRKEAAALIAAYFEEFPGVKSYMDAVIEQAKEQGYVTTLMGRKHFLKDINSRNATVRGFAERNAINTPIQGSAAEMIKLAMIQIHQWMKKEQLKSTMIMQVHDELVFDVHPSELVQLKMEIPLLMKNAMLIGVPIEVEVGVGKNWLEAH